MTDKQGSIIIHKFLALFTARKKKKNKASVHSETNVFFSLCLRILLSERQLCWHQAARTVCCSVDKDLGAQRARQDNPSSWYWSCLAAMRATGTAPHADTAHRSVSVFWGKCWCNSTKSCFSSLFSLSGWNSVRANKSSWLKSTACSVPVLQAWLVAAACACSQCHLKQLLDRRSSSRGPALPSIQHKECEGTAPHQC